MKKQKQRASAFISGAIEAKSVVVALDFGTSSVRAAAFDQDGILAAPVAKIAYEQTTTSDGGVEIGADFLLDLAARCLDELLPQIQGEIVGVGTSCFWHSLMAVDDNGEAKTAVLSWADNRSAAQIPQLRALVDETAAHARLGCVFHTSYWPAKLLWLRETRPELFQTPLSWMGMGEYLGLKWHNRAQMSLSMASGTGIFRQNPCVWDAEMLRHLPVESAQFPPLCDAHDALPDLRPDLRARWPKLTRAKWFAALGDGACSNIGSSCANETRIGLNAGTSGAMRVVLRDFGGAAPAGFWRYRVDSRRSIVGGALSNAGNALSWARETLRLPDDWAAQISQIAPDSHGLTILPFLAGERAPIWNANARFVLEGAGLDATPISILRAILEGVALRYGALGARLLELAPDAQIVFSGGVLERIPVWAPILCDVLGASLIGSRESEASARGAALMALEALGLIDDVAKLPLESGEIYQPNLENHQIYRRALERQNALYAKIYR